MLLCFVDESGDHVLDRIDPYYPIFVLVGLLVDEEHYETVIVPEMAQIKRKLFGHDGVVFHTADITRNRNGFERLKDPRFRLEFYETLNEAMARWEYTVAAVVVDKRRHKEVYGEAALDPYELSLKVLVERLVFEVEERGSQAKVTAESRAPHLDGSLKRAWEDLLQRGTHYLSAKRLRRALHRSELEFRKKRENIAGLQLADLVATPIGRWYLKKPLKEDWRIIEQKLRRGPQGYMGYGLVVLPKPQQKD